MKFRARLLNNAFARSLRGGDDVLREAVTTAAAEALRTELQRNTATPLSISGAGLRRNVGSNDPHDAERELGTLEKAPSPWLAPALPTALEPMRAAARSAAARAVSMLGKRKK